MKGSWMLPKLTTQELNHYLKIISNHQNGHRTKFSGFKEGFAKDTPEWKELNRMAEYAIFRTYNDTDQRFESTLNNK